MQTHKMFRVALMSLVLSAAAFSGAAMAQAGPVAGHPRVNEVNQRLDNQQNRIQSGVASGKMNSHQAARDERHDANIAQRESADEARNGGHLTKTEQHHLNHSLNKNSRHIYKQKH
jgi:hypothetical protein